MGIIVGAFVAHGGNPEAALFAIVAYLSSAVLDQSHTIIICSSLLVAATANILTQAGAVTALILHLGRLVRQRRSLMVTSWLSGLVLFFDDYANCLVSGNLFAPIYDRCRVSREKLAYIVDSTAAPIASISVISTWIGYELDLISKALKNLSISDSAFFIFLQSIPYRFYSIFTLAFVAFIAFSGMDFGPMKQAELRAARQQKVKILPGKSLPNQQLIWLATTAISLMVFVTLCILIIDGYNTIEFTQQTSLARIISAAGISFSTGSSFGTMGILIPIILPLSVPLQREMDDFIFFLAPLRF